MQRSFLTNPVVVAIILVLQIVPLILFPLSVLTPKTQDWWLPTLLAIMILVADFQIIARRNVTLGPWSLLAFAQGFNIISRLMMVWAHATVPVNRVNVPNVSYIVLTVVSVALSAFILWYTEKAEVRMAFLPR
jgi:hypothetical protein